MSLKLDPSRVTLGRCARSSPLHGLDILSRRIAGWLPRFGLQRPLNAPTQSALVGGSDRDRFYGHFLESKHGPTGH